MARLPWTVAARSGNTAVKSELAARFRPEEAQKLSAEMVVALGEVGIDLRGGCCGSTSAHMAAMDVSLRRGQAWGGAS